MRDRTFRRVMPVIGLATIAVVVATAVAARPGLPRGLAVLASAAVLADAVFTVRRQLPLNRQIEGWTEARIPLGWMRVRDRWQDHHQLRVLLGVVAYGCVLAAMALTLDGGA